MKLAQAAWSLVNMLFMTWTLLQLHLKTLCFVNTGFLQPLVPCASCCHHYWMPEKGTLPTPLLPQIPAPRVAFYIFCATGVTLRMCSVLQPQPHSLKSLSGWMLMMDKIIKSWANLVLWSFKANINWYFFLKPAKSCLKYFVFKLLEKAYSPLPSFHFHNFYPAEEVLLHGLNPSLSSHMQHPQVIPLQTRKLEMSRKNNWHSAI